MNKLVMLIILILSFTTCTFATTNLDRLDINEYLNNRTVSDLVIEISDELKLDNYENPVTLKLDGGLRIIFSGEQDLINTFNPEVEIFGIYSPLLNAIGINVEAINIFLDSTNETEENINLKIFNTFQHEVTHYLEDKTQLPDISETLNITYSTFPLVSNVANFQFFAISGATFDLPSIIIPTVDFQFILFPFVTNQYDVQDTSSELIARLTSICIGEDQNYVNYFDMIVIKDSIYCNTLTFDERIDRNYNNFYTEFFVSHIKVYDASRYYEVLKTTNQLPTVGQNIGDFLSNLVFGIISFTLSFGIIGIIISLILTISTLIVKVVRERKR